MATTDVQIANLALSFVGAQRVISSLTEDTAGAEIANLWYNEARKQTLEAYNWSFARKRLTLAVHADAPPAEWAYRYTYPSGIVAVRSIWNPLGQVADAIEYEVEQIAAGTATCILTNMQNAIAICTGDVTSAALFSPSFTTAFARKLAECIAYSLTGNLNVANQQTQHFAVLIQQAAALDAQQSVGPKPRDADWVKGRR